LSTQQTILKLLAHIFDFSVSTSNTCDKSSTLTCFFSRLVRSCSRCLLLGWFVCLFYQSLNICKPDQIPIDSSAIVIQSHPLLRICLRCVQGGFAGRGRRRGKVNPA
jgi:hypothetical protein